MTSICTYLYYGGKRCCDDEKQGLPYKGLGKKCEIFLLDSTLNTLDGLKREIMKELDVNPQSHDITITYRAPHEVLSHHVTYRHVLIKGNKHVQIMFDKMRSTPQVKAIELYIRVKPLMEVGGEEGQKKTLEGEGGKELQLKLPDVRYTTCINNTIAIKSAPYKVQDMKQKSIVMDWDEYYKLLPKLMTALKDSNPTTKVEWKIVNSPIRGNAFFRRVFWAFGPSIEGFKHCRPVISIDAIVLYGKCQAWLLIAMAVDAENEVFPLAFAIVEGESCASWSWFLYCIRLYVTQRQGICLISSQHKGIISALSNPHFCWRPDNMFHRFCLRHIASNFNERFHDKHLMEMIMKAGHANQLWKFNAIMEAIRNYNSDAGKSLDEIPLEMWTLAYDGGRRYGVMTTHLPACLDVLLKGAQNLPITAMVQSIFIKLAQYFNNRRTKIQAQLKEGQLFSKYAINKFDRYVEKSKRHTVTIFDREHGTFQIWISMNPGIVNRGNDSQVRTGFGFASRGDRSQAVKLDERTCSCGKWQIFKIPCSHVIASCHAVLLNGHQFIDPCYRLAEQLACYKPQFNSIPNVPYRREAKLPKLYTNPSMARQQSCLKPPPLRNEMDYRKNQPPKRGVCHQEECNHRKRPNVNLTASSCDSSTQVIASNKLSLTVF